MCLGSKPKVPKVSEPKEPPKEVSEGVKRSRNEEDARARALKGDRATILTGAAGLMNEANIGRKQVLGG